MGTDDAATMGLIDSHAHLTFPQLRDRVDEVLLRCREAGVEQVVSVGTDLADATAALALTRQHAGQVFAAIGFHPHEAQKVTDEHLHAMARLWDDTHVVAVGEMGLDYHYDFSPRETQRRVFRAQLELAKAVNKPVVIHAREAFEDTVALLVEQGYRDQGVVFHCFTGTADEAEVIAQHGWRISFTGIVTFKNSRALQQIAKAYPAEKMMVETDSPYLSPVPLRSQRPCEPSFVAHTARFLADLRGVPYDQLVEETARNTRAFFGIG